MILEHQKQTFANNKMVQPAIRYELKIYSQKKNVLFVSQSSQVRKAMRMHFWTTISGLKGYIIKTAHDPG